MNAIWDWILALIASLFGGGETKPITVGAHVYMPLFYHNLNGVIDMTWNYISKSDAEKKHLRDYIKAGAKSGETPAISFLLTPANCNGGLLPDNMSAITDAMLDVLKTKCEELVEDGIAVFPCLYADDCSPRWFAIENHMPIWSRIYGRIAKYVTGYILSIETNEQASNVGHIEGCINAMRSAMPGAAYYGTHLQWHGGGRYSWQDGASTPKNANIILAEFTWDPHKGDAVGLQAIKNEFYDIQRANPTLQWVAHEYNTNAGSATCEAQKAWLRSQGAWGVA